METPWRIFEETQPIKLYAKNQMIYLQEETAIRFYYLKKGRVKIFLSSPDGLEKTLAVLQPGSLFGEASFFDGKPRVSSAKTLEKSEILSIDRTGLFPPGPTAGLSLAAPSLRHHPHALRPGRQHGLSAGGCAAGPAAALPCRR